MGFAKQALFEREQSDRIEQVYDLYDQGDIHVTDWESQFLDSNRGQSWDDLSPAQQGKLDEIWEEFQSRLSMHNAMMKDD